MKANLLKVVRHVPAPVTKQFGRALLTTKTHSPTILFVGGVAGVVATTVLACRATLKLEEVLEDAENKLDDVNTLQHSNYSESDRRQDKIVVYTQTVVKISKLYGPPLILGTLSIAALTGSHRILTTRNAGLTAAYAAVEKAFSQYRGRVVDELGEEKDREFRYGAVKREIAEDTKKGPKVSEITTVDSRKQPSQYARFFDETNNNWKSWNEYNRIFLDGQQRYANDLLHAKGHVFLNDVYDMLGMERSRAGAVVGWVLNQGGDNYINFGMYNSNDPDARAFVNGLEGAILLDFNVDGVVYDKLPED